MPLGMEVGLGPGDFVLDGDVAPLPKKVAEPPCPQFSAHVYCGQTVGWINMVLGMEVGLGPGPKRGQSSPQFSAHFYCCQTAVCITILLGTEVGDIVVDGDPPRSPLKGHFPQFLANVCCGQTARWIKMPLGIEVRLGPGDFVFDGELM